MKILVIGGTRFLGYHLVRRLLAEGQEVTLFNRGLTPDDFGSRVKRIRGDRTKPEEMKKVFRHFEFDAVIDFIAYNGQESEGAVEIFSGRTGHYIHISTGAVYIVTRNYPCPLREEDFDRELREKPAKPDPLWSYGLGKRECELVLRRAYEERAFPVTIFRLPIIIGERDYTLRAYSYFIRLKDGGPVLLPDAGLNVFTHVYQGDVVRTIATNLLNPQTFGKAYNLAMEEIISLRGFIELAAEIMGREVEIIDIPSRLLQAMPCGLSISPFSSRRAFVLSVDKARRDLGFKSTPLASWLEKTISWFFSEYRGPQPENYRWRSFEISLADLYSRKLEEMKRQFLEGEGKNG